MFIRKELIKENLKTHIRKHVRYTVRFDSNHGLLDYIDHNKTTASKYNSSISGSKKFTHTESYNEAVELLQYGWPDGKKAVKTKLKKLERFVHQKMDLTVHDSITADVVGFAPHIANYIAGTPDSMFAFEADEKPTITVQYNCAVSWNIGGAVIRQRGATTLALIRSIQAAGYNVELLVTVGLGGFGIEQKKMYVIYPVLNSGDMLNIDKTCFMLCHPSYFRRFVFALMERTGFLKDEYGDVGRGYGYPDTVPPEIVSADIVIPEARGDCHHWQSAESAGRWLIGELVRQGLAVNGK